MGGGYLGNAGVFLVQTLFGLYIFAVLLRLMLQYVRADFYNPLAQAIVTITDPPLRPMRRYIPGVAGIDMSSVLLALVLQFICTTLVHMIVNIPLGVIGTFVVSCAEILSKCIWIMIGGILLQVLASWIAPGTYNPVMSMIDSITAPIIRPFRRLIPPISGLDLSPLAALIVLNLSLLLIVSPLKGFGFMLG